MKEIITTAIMAFAVIGAFATVFIVGYIVMIMLDKIRSRR
jgi:hypothetical protein